MEKGATKMKKGPGEEAMKRHDANHARRHAARVLEYPPEEEEGTKEARKIRQERILDTPHDFEWRVIDQNMRYGSATSISSHLQNGYHDRGFDRFDGAWEKQEGSPKDPDHDLDIYDVWIKRTSYPCEECGSEVKEA
jgi:hypothetical protein